MRKKYQHEKRFLPLSFLNYRFAVGHNASESAARDRGLLDALVGAGDGLIGPRQRVEGACFSFRFFKSLEREQRAEKRTEQKGARLAKKSH